PVLSSEFGLFENIHGAKDGAEFSDALRAAATRDYGHVGPLFVQQLIDHYAVLRLHDQLATILKEFGEAGLSAQDTRVAKSFAVAALAGELAIAWGVLPWEPRTAIYAALTIFNYWKTTQPESSKSKEAAQVVQGYRDFIETRDADFSDADWTAD